MRDLRGLPISETTEQWASGVNPPAPLYAEPADKERSVEAFYSAKSEQSLGNSSSFPKPDSSPNHVSLKVEADPSDIHLQEPLPLLSGAPRASVKRGAQDASSGSMRYRKGNLQDPYVPTEISKDLGLTALSWPLAKKKDDIPSCPNKVHISVHIRQLNQIRTSSQRFFCAFDVALGWVLSSEAVGKLPRDAEGKVVGNGSELSDADRNKPYIAILNACVEEWNLRHEYYGNLKEVEAPGCGKLIYCIWYGTYHAHLYAPFKLKHFPMDFQALPIQVPVPS